MKPLLAFGAATIALALPVAALCQAASAAADPMPPARPDPTIAATLRNISPDAIHADIAKLVSFGTRSTLSSMDTDLPAGQGINAAADWIESQFQAISAQCNGCLEVKRDSFVEQPTSDGRSRLNGPTRLVNVYAVLHGTSSDKAAPWTLVTGHYDSRATDVMDSHINAPGANDDASGVAVSLESARALSKLKLTGTIVFVAVAGEEQGLYGSHHLAELARSEGWPLVAVLNNDIVGGDTTPGETGQPKDVVRVFSESVPATATPEQQRQILALGAENDSPSRELARRIAQLAPAYFAEARHPAADAFHPVLVLRRDRYLRGGDHTSFNNAGFAAVRFTEWRENFDHQHQTVRSENGVQYGDLLKYVDPDYVARVARLNAAVLATLADAPSEPQQVRILTHNLDNNTELAWQPSAFAPPGTTYEVLWRATTDELWTHAHSAGAAAHITLPVSKDNVLFGVRAVDAAGHASLPVPPIPARQ
jgi:hypothetical protein